MAGFIVLPMMGLHGGFMMASAVYLGLALAIAPDRRWTLGAAATAAAALLASGATPLAYLRRGETLRARIEGPSGIVTVVDTEDDRQLRLDNHYLLGGSAAAATERRLGLVPLLLHPAPRRVAFVGMATGISASAGPALGVAETTVVELVPGVAAAAGAYFAPWNAGLLDRSDVQLVVDDGRHHLATTGMRYDVIVGDLFVPWHAGAGNLWTYEAFTNAAARLAPGGLYCQWLPLYQLTREEFDVIARTFLAVFPHVSVWRDDFYADRPVVGLVGSAMELPFDEAALRARLESVSAWARDPLLATPRGLAMLSLGELSSTKDLVAAGALNTDDRPVIEFLAPRLTRMGPDGDKDWFTGAPLVEFASALADRTPDGDAEGRRAGLALQRWALAVRGGDVAAAARLREEVRLRVPDVIAGVDGEPAMLADARRTLAALRDEAGRVRSEIETAERRLHEISRAEEGR